MGWDELVAGGLEVFFVPSYPAQVVEEPFVRDLAIKLRSYIPEAAARKNSVPETDAREYTHDTVSFSPPATTAALKALCGAPIEVGTLKACQ